MYEFEALEDYFQRINTPKKEWIGLTDEDVTNIYDNCINIIDGMRQVEALLKEKNQ